MVTYWQLATGIHWYVDPTDRVRLLFLELLDYHGMGMSPNWGPLQVSGGSALQINAVPLLNIVLARSAHGASPVDGRR